MSQTVSLVTGASSGIGLEMSRLLAAEGHNLVLVARSQEVLQALAEELQQQHRVSVWVKPCDLSTPAAARSLWKELREERLLVDHLLNNAGYALHGPFLELSLEDQLNMVSLNVSTLTALSFLAGREMVQQGGGRILNVASTAAFQPGPLMAVYYATKAYVLSFSEALANELEGSDVSVTALCPGPTRSGFQERAGMGGSRLLKFSMMEAREVARVGIEAMKEGKRTVIPGLLNTFLANTVRLTPRGLVLKISRLLTEKK